MIMNPHFSRWKRSKSSIRHCVEEVMGETALLLIANGNIEHYIDNLSIFIKNIQDLHSL